MRRFFSTTMVLLLGSTLSRALGLAMIPVYTRTISPTDMGQYDVWFNSLTFAAPLLFAQIWDAVYRYSFAPHGDTRTAVSNGTAVMIVGSVAYSIVCPAALWALQPAHPVLVFLQGPAIVTGYFLGFIARAHLKNTLFAASGVLSAIVNVVTTLALLHLTEAGIAALYSGYLAGASIQALILTLALRQALVPQASAVSRALIMSMLRYTLPLCAASVAYWALAGYARISLAIAEGTAANGLFSVADRFGMLITLAVTALQMAWQEFLFTGEQDQASGRARSARALMSGTLAAGAVIMVAAYASFDVLVGPRYEDAQPLMPILIAAATLNGAANFVTGLFMLGQDTRPVLWSTALGAVVNLILCPVLIQALGALGASLALATSFLIMLVSRMLLATHRLGTPMFSPGVTLQLVLLLLTAGAIAQATSPWFALVSAGLSTGLAVKTMIFLASVEEE